MGSAAERESAAAGLMPVAEAFVSINGEGTHAGRLASFVRFAGCNLRCSYCDTTWANDASCEVAWQSVDDIAAWVAAQPAACTTLTGGEPALQPLLPDLVRALLALPPACDGAAEGFSSAARIVEIETNGSVGLARLAQVRAEARKAHLPGELSLTMDWKLPSSGVGDRMLSENLALLDARDTVKFVTGSRDDLEEMHRVISEFSLCDRCSVYVSPVFGRIDPADIVEFLRERALVRVTLQLQLHKIIWPHTEKGV